MARSAPSSSDGSPARAAISTAIGSATRRRTANSSACALGRVQPVGVVDQQQQRPGVGVGRQQAERGRADREAFLGRARAQGERPLERDRLRLRYLFEPGQGGPDQLEQRRERNLGLGLDPARPQDPQAFGPLGRVVEQGGLADARLPDQGHNRAGPRPRRLHCAVDLPAFPVTPHQHEAILGALVRRATKRAND